MAETLGYAVKSIGPLFAGTIAPLALTVAVPLVHVNGPLPVGATVKAVGLVMLRAHGLVPSPHFHLPVSLQVPFWAASLAAARSE
jgi:hypothetical protein